ncbi:MAG: cobaltochelatase subunit CobN [Pirellulales bacterium]|nr:cobaltochelatase subunit CobN [Pirellulales bacterium]
MVCQPSLPAQTSTDGVDSQADSTPPPPVLVLHTYLMPPARRHKLRQVAELAAVELQFLAADSLDTETLASDIAAARLILIDLPHESVIGTVVANAAELIREADKPYLLIGDLDQVRRGEPLAADPLRSEHRLAGSWATRIRQYYRFGGRDNTALLVQALAGDHPGPDDSQLSLPQAKPFPEQGFYHPDWPEIETGPANVAAKLAGREKPVVAIAINLATLAADDTEWLDALMAALAGRGLNAYAFYGPRRNRQRISQMTGYQEDGRTIRLADLVINAALVFQPQQTKAELDRRGIPVIQTLPSLDRDAEQWAASDDGLPFANIAYYYASSELAGMVDPTLIAAREAATGLLRPTDEQIELLADRAQALCRLQRSKPRQRRVALVVYNYPPGENNFGASFLNVPESLVSVLAALRQAGYDTRQVDQAELTTQIQASLKALYDPASLISLWQQDDADFLPLSDYESWFEQLPQPTRKRIVDYWGSPASMAVELPDEDSPRQGFVIPAVRLGNVCVLPQPLRHEITTATGKELRKKRIQHQSTVPLSHTYLATYLFLREQWRAHAVVHFGTHGTLEWAPGKQRALAGTDDPSLALGTLPNIYPYIMDNLGEATTAKRRGRAVIISHLTPMFTPAGFRPGLHEMHDLMHDWETVSSGPVRKQMERRLIELFVEHKLDRDLGWTEDRIADEFAGFMEVLHPYLDDVAQTAQPQGLAVFGEVPDQTRRFGMVMQMLRTRLIDALGEDIDEVFLLDAEKVTNSRPARWLRLALKNPQAASQLDLREIDRLDISKHTSVPNRAEDKVLDPAELLGLARQAQRLETVLATNREMATLLEALDGKHVPSSYGGDPVRNPESLPTGRNLYGFDPTRVPTRQAWEIATGVLDDWIQTYRQNHRGNYPRQIAFTMWAGETMRHHGIMESQVLYAMGVRPSWNDAGRMTGVELIPAAQLQRPRIDVLLSVTGSYRDQFPHVMKWIDQAVTIAARAEMPEPAGAAAEDSSNYVAQHVRALRRHLEASGVEAGEASRQSAARIFSNEAGCYGTGLNNAAYYSDLWDSQTNGGGDAEMAELFVHRMGYAYGDGLGGVKAAELFAKQIANVDAAFLSRSSNTYGVLTSDDPFAYLGGFALAARVANETPPELYVQNLRDPSEVIVDSAATAIAKEMQTRYLHPQWIQAQQAEGYSGTLQVLKATQFLWGWQVTAPETVREDQWQAMMDVYVHDQYQLGTRQWFQRHNHQVLAQVLERMVDAVRLGYWKPDQATRQELFAAYEQAKQDSDLIENNEQVMRFVSEQRKPAVRPDPRASRSERKLDPVAADSSSVPTSQQASSQQERFVRGQQLRTVAAATPPDRARSWSGIVAVVLASLLILLGGVLQYRRLASEGGKAG